ncbi:MAG: hypothetical protein IJ960_00040 [Oscillospiraceae bacterium]|nr:hypothetical protein [Oscillospiraceae bacterium]
MSLIIIMYGMSFLLTLVIELPICYAWGLRSRDALELAFLVNLLTNPAAVFLHTSVGIPQIPVEILVVIIECYIYRQFKIKHPFLLSLAANGVSWGLGVVLQML